MALYSPPGNNNNNPPPLLLLGFGGGFGGLEGGFNPPPGGNAGGLEVNLKINHIERESNHIKPIEFGGIEAEDPNEWLK